MLHLFEFVWTLRSLVLVVFNNFLLIDTTSKISSDQKRFFIALSLDPLSFFANTPFNFTIFVLFFQSFISPTHVCFLTKITKYRFNPISKTISNVFIKISQSEKKKRNIFIKLFIFQPSSLFLFLK